MGENQKVECHAASFHFCMCVFVCVTRNGLVKGSELVLSVSAPFFQVKAQDVASQVDVQLWQR